MDVIGRKARVEVCGVLVKVERVSERERVRERKREEGEKGNGVAQTES